MKRVFDAVFALILLAPLSIPMLIIGLLIRLTSRGPAIYYSNRIGLDNKIFKMLKFRTMRLGAPPMATHLMRDPDQYVTPMGRVLRRTSVDELPQLFNILKGDMSFVGPRPALYNQDDLVALRTARGIHRIVPGLTGWAQINGRDELPIPVKVGFDEYYLHHHCWQMDLKIICRTAAKALRGEGVSH